MSSCTMSQKFLVTTKQNTKSCLIANVSMSSVNTQRRKVTLLEPNFENELKFDVLYRIPGDRKTLFSRAYGSCAFVLDLTCCRSPSCLQLPSKRCRLRPAKLLCFQLLWGAFQGHSCMPWQWQSDKVTKWQSDSEKNVIDEQPNDQFTTRATSGYTAQSRTERSALAMELAVLSPTLPLLASLNPSPTRFVL